MPGEEVGQRTLAGYRLCGHKESDRTEYISRSHFHLRSKEAVEEAKSHYVGPLYIILRF